MSAQYLGTGYSKVVADLFGEVLLDLSVRGIDVIAPLVGFL